MGKKKNKKKSHVKHVHIKPAVKETPTVLSLGMQKILELGRTLGKELEKPENQKMFQEKLKQATQLRKEKFEAATIGGSLPMFSHRDENDELVIWRWESEKEDSAIILTHHKNREAGTMQWWMQMYTSPGFTPEKGKEIAECLLSANLTMETYIRDNPPVETTVAPVPRSVVGIDGSEVEKMTAEQVGVVFDPNAFVPGPDPQVPPWMPKDDNDDDDDYPLGEIAG